MSKQHRKLQQLDLKERHRLQDLTRFEEKGYEEGFQSIAGVDEAGRGPLAGPVVAAACIIPKNIFFPGIDDSKRLTAKQRSALFSEITCHQDVHFAIGLVPHTKIDEVNILQATLLAMLQAVSKLAVSPDLLLVDGSSFTHLTIPTWKIIKGDAKSQSIAAASILAKVYRDQLMETYHRQWPQYGFAQHKGYATKAHCEAIRREGICPIHRLTFEPIKSLLTSLRT